MKPVCARSPIAPPIGTEAFQLIKTARELGFAGSRKHTLASLDELKDLIAQELYPIVDMADSRRIERTVPFNGRRRSGAG
jgi:hypothetical protein